MMSHGGIEVAQQLFASGDRDGLVAWYEEEVRLNEESDSPWAYGNANMARFSLDRARQRRDEVKA
jgi:hypothetical protein